MIVITSKCELDDGDAGHAWRCPQTASLHVWHVHDIMVKVAYQHKRVSCNEIEELTTDRWCLVDYIRAKFNSK